MVMIALCGSLIGAVFGTRFKVYALLPTILLGLVLVAAIAAIRGAPLSAAIAAAAVWTVFLQFGYLGALLTQLCLTADRQPLRGSLRSTNTARN